jgi:hypothetical protein
MLKKESAAVRLYLERAAIARERALVAAASGDRRFYLDMESQWMKLAASTAFAERVDLFLQTREFGRRLSPSDLCRDCNERMEFHGVHTTLETEEHIFKCRICGSTHTRRLRGDDSPIS